MKKYLCICFLCMVGGCFSPSIKDERHPQVNTNDFSNFQPNTNSCFK